MAVQNNNPVFVVKDRIEALESRIETALDESGLKDFSRQAAREAIRDVVEDVIQDLERLKKSAVEDLKVERVDVDSRLSEVQGVFDVAIREHVQALADRVDRLEKLVGATAILGIITLIASIAL